MTIYEAISLYVADVTRDCFSTDAMSLVGDVINLKPS